MGSKKIQKRLFGTNGVRGVIGVDMTPELVMHIGLALGSMVNGTIAIGRDTRTSGEALASAIKAGIMACGSDVVDLGILPTPALQYVVRDHFAGGAMITASHNPPEYNGVKIIDADGTEMADEKIIPLEERVFSRRFNTVGWDRVGSETAAPHMVEEYVSGIVRHFPDAIGTGITVVVDPGSGPSAQTTPTILSRMGCRVFTINAQMDGRFPGRLPEPSPEGLQGLSEMVIRTGAAFGVAHDGDADRAVFIDEKGQYIEENQEFALIEEFICRNQTGSVVTPVSSSRLIEAVAQRNGCTIEYTPVGSIYVARRMKEMIDSGESVVFGGEGNGGLIYPTHQFCRDGAMTAAMMVYLLATERTPLSVLLTGLPSFHMIKDKIRTENAAGILQAIESAYAGQPIDHTDGLRISLDTSWALIRASGTEPLLRITVESEEKEAAEAFYRAIMQHIRA
jgi:phosphomannomutase / phosphoglucomutase